jgi:chemotaxis protein histidine kinase CheA
MSESSAASESMLVRSENLDQLLLLAGEVIIASSNLGMAYRSLQNLYDRRQPVSREALESLKDLAGSTTDISSNLHHLVQAIRTVDMKDVCFRAKRLARDLARKTGKRIRFDVRGEDTVVDKSIVEKLYDPIEHQLRNAIDHGIEDAAVRAAAGKPEEGVVSLTISNTERETFIEIEDDGAGLDLEALRRKAVEAGTIQEGDPFTEEDALDIMCAPGVSTARVLTEVSGRGVGMDVVRARIHELGGTVSFTTRRGAGTRFTFRVPLVSAVNIVDALVVRAGETMYAFPIGSVVSTTSVARDAVHSAFGKGETITYLDRLLPLFDLAGVLAGTASPRPETDIPVLIVEHKENQVAFVVDAFLAPQKLVIIPIQETLPIPEFSGATILGGRKLGLIVNVPGLINRALDRRAAGVSAAAAVGESEAVPADASAADGREAPEAVPDRGGPEPAAPGRLPAENREFLLEIERLIPALNEALFSLESNPAGRDPVNLAFRLFHTIKGNFMMIGLPLGGGTIHSVESVLDRVRTSRQPVTPEIMDILMDGASFIEEAVRAGLAGAWTDRAGEDIQQRAQRLLSVLAPPETAAAAESDEIVLSHEAAYRAVIHRKRRTPTYLCHVEFESGPQPAFLVACLIYRRFCDLGDVLGTRPALADLEKGRGDNVFRVRFASPLPRERLEQVLGALLREHYGATIVEIKRFE